MDKKKEKELVKSLAWKLMSMSYALALNLHSSSNTFVYWTHK